MHRKRLRDMHCSDRIAVNISKGFYNYLYRVLEKFLRSGTRHSAFNLMVIILRNTK